MDESSREYATGATRRLPPMKLLALTSLLTLCAGCGSKTAISESDDESTSTAAIHVAFAGGGWRAHTGHAAWVMSLLDANSGNCALQSGDSGNPQCLGAAFANVETVSGNSGGSWFSTMLMHDKGFVSQITNAEAFSDWGSTDATNPAQGWLGKQQGYFIGFDSKCGSDHGAAYVECVLEKYFSDTLIPTPNWDSFVQNLVFEGYDWNNYGTLGNASRQPWAADKPLLMAGTLLTSSVNLNDNNTFGDEYYYQICQNPNTTASDGDDGGWCVDSNGQRIPRSQASPDVLPVTFSSMAANSAALTAPSFIALQNTQFGIEYAEAYAISGPTPKANTISSGVNKTDNVPVIEAAAASSAAAGYAASYWVVGSKIWDESYHARDLAIGFNLPNDGQNQVGYVSDTTLDGLSFEDLNTDRVFKAADGGAIDNSAVAQLISYLQLNNMGDGFNVIAFDEVQTNDSSDKNKFPSSDISYMFEGAPAGGVCIKKKYCVEVPNLVILKPNPVSQTPITKYVWTVPGETNYLYYYVYEVETVANANFNVTGGQTGTLHVFSTQFACADTAPENNNDFACYNDMLAKIGATLKNTPDNKASTNTGYDFLTEAFMLP